MLKKSNERVYPFIVLEGCDGVGKTTIRTILQKKLEELGYNCTILGQHSWLDLDSSRIILDVREARNNHEPKTIVDAYFTDKRLHSMYNILPALKESIVICDRYICSDAVYQEVLYGISARDTLSRHKINRTLFPDIFIYIETDVSVAYQRILKRSKTIRHYEKPTKMSKIINVYNNILSKGEILCLSEIVRFNNTKKCFLEKRIENEILSIVLKYAPVYQSSKIAIEANNYEC